MHECFHKLEYGLMTCEGLGRLTVCDRNMLSSKRVIYRLLIKTGSKFWQNSCRHLNEDIAGKFFVRVDHLGPVFVMVIST